MNALSEISLCTYIVGVVSEMCSNLKLHSFCDTARLEGHRHKGGVASMLMKFKID